MNVAFGPDGVVYTAEDNTGRIKRYSPDGKLLGLVGSVELVPGCKNCSIAVSSDGSRVYMLDITRGHIVRMERYKPGETPPPEKSRKSPCTRPSLSVRSPQKCQMWAERLRKACSKSSATAIDRRVVLLLILQGQ